MVFVIFTFNIYHCILLQKKQVGTEIALNHFDQFYSSVFENWPSIRLALLCPHSYCAVANVFAKERSSEALFGDLDVFNMKDAYYLQLGELGTVEMPSEKSNKNAETESNKQPLTEEPQYENKSTMPIVVDETKGEYMPVTEYKHREFDEEDISSFYVPNPSFKAHVIKHGVIHYPEHWEMYYCPKGKFRKFPSPCVDETGLLSES